MGTVVALVKALDEVAPFKHAEPWDKVGLQVGRPSAPIERVMLTVDLTREVLDEAIKAKVQAIVGIHPIIWKPIDSITPRAWKGEILLDLVQAGIAYIAFHSNFDCAEGGINDLMMDAFGCRKVRPLRPSAREAFIRMVVVVKRDDEETAAQALLKSGALIDPVSSPLFGSEVRRIDLTEPAGSNGSKAAADAKPQPEPEKSDAPTETTAAATAPAKAKRKGKADAAAATVAASPATAATAVSTPPAGTGSNSGAPSNSKAAESAKPEAATPPASSPAPAAGTVYVRLEAMVPVEQTKNVVTGLRSALPDAHYELLPLSNTDKPVGLGRVGELPQRIPASKIIQEVKKMFAVKQVRVVGAPATKVKRLAVCAGSGGNLIQNANNYGATCYVTADVKHHDALLARELGMVVIDPGHSPMERWALPHVRDQLALKLPGVDVRVSTINTNPFAETFA